MHPVTKYEPSEDNFRYLNGDSGRTGLDSSSLCYVCGEPVHTKYVFCAKHLKDFNQRSGQRDNWMVWVVNHPDFSGIDFDGRQRTPHIFPRQPNAEDVYLKLRVADP